MGLGTQVLALVAHAKPAKTKAEPKSRKSQKGGAVNVGAPVPAPEVYKEPSMADKMRSTANYAKLDATRDWVNGRISTKKHDQAHARANEVISNTRRFVKGRR